MDLVKLTSPTPVWHDLLACNLRSSTKKNRTLCVLDDPDWFFLFIVYICLANCLIDRVSWFVFGLLICLICSCSLFIHALYIYKVNSIHPSIHLCIFMCVYIYRRGFFFLWYEPVITPVSYVRNPNGQNIKYPARPEDKHHHATRSNHWSGQQQRKHPNQSCCSPLERHVEQISQWGDKECSRNLKGSDRPQDALSRLGSSQ